MINITKAQAKQLTTEGVDSEWVVTLEGEELYRLPSHFTVQETFMVRDIIEQMMNKASDAMKKQEQQLCIVKMNRVIESGDSKLDYLKQENERLAVLLDQFIGEGSVNGHH